MKHTILHSRRASRVSVFLSLVLVTLVLAATPGPGSDARAFVTFSYSGSHQLTWTANGAKSLTINRTGGYTALSVDAYLLGNKKFTLDYQNVYWPDSSMDTGYLMPRYFTVRFSSSIPDTCIGWLVLSDSTTRDTIQLTGYGTANTIDFTVADTSRSITVSDSGNIPAVVIDGIYNLQSSAIRVSLSLTDSNYWDLDGHGGDEVITIPGSQKASFTLTYTPHGVYHDYVTIWLTCSSPYYEQRTVNVEVTDPRYAPVYYTPTVTAPDLGLVQPGDSACGTVTVANRTVQAITITNISNDSVEWSESGLPNLPLTLQPGGTTSFTVCYYAPPDQFGSYASNRYYVSYRDSSGLTGSVGATATAHTTSCMETLIDSIHLDDVISGGYVEATAVFLSHRTFVLTAGKGYVSSGGTATIVAPLLPLQVHAGDTISLRFRVTPGADSSSSTYYAGDIPLADSGCYAQISFSGHATTSTTSNLQLFPAESELLDMTTTSQATIDTFWFVNNLATPVHIPLGGVSLAQGTRFHILGELPHDVPDTITPNQSLGVIIEFDGDTNGYYHDSLMIQASQNLQAFATYNLEAMYHKMGSGVSVGPAVSPASLAIVPNPAEGPVGVTVANAMRASIEIFDVIGNRIAVMPNTLAGTWDAAGIGGGIYIVRASGTDQDGNAFTISKRLILK